MSKLKTLVELLKPIKGDKLIAKNIWEDCIEHKRDKFGAICAITGSITGKYVTYGTIAYWTISYFVK